MRFHYLSRQVDMVLWDFYWVARSDTTEDRNSPPFLCLWYYKSRNLQHCSDTTEAPQAKSSTHPNTPQSRPIPHPPPSTFLRIIGYCIPPTVRARQGACMLGSSSSPFACSSRFAQRTMAYHDHSCEKDPIDWVENHLPVKSHLYNVEII